MKITLEFADFSEARDALDAPHIRAALEDIYQYLRAQVKHAEVPATAYEIKDRFHEILEKHRVDLLT